VSHPARHATGRRVNKSDSLPRALLLTLIPWLVLPYQSVLQLVVIASFHVSRTPQQLEMKCVSFHFTAMNAMK
jgi:hypothetical protein